MKKIKCLGLLALPLLLLSTANAALVVGGVGGVGPLRIEEWCPQYYPNDIDGCLGGVYVDAYPTNIIWGSYGRGYGRGFGRDGAGRGFGGRGFGRDGAGRDFGRDGAGRDFRRDGAGGMGRSAEHQGMGQRAGQGRR